MALIIKTGRLKLPESRSRKVYSCIPTLSTPVASPARPVKRSAVVIMHPDKYLPELVAEKNSLDPSFVHAVRLLAEGKSGIFQVSSTLSFVDLFITGIHHVPLQLGAPLHCILVEQSDLM